MKSLQKIFIFIFLFYSISCQKKSNISTMKFIQSKTMSNLYLIKELPSDEKLVQTGIIHYINENPPQNLSSLPTLHFYKYTEENNDTGFGNNGTSYFLDNLPDSGGFSSEELENYADEKIAALSISICSDDTTKYVGKFYYYGLKGLNNGFEKTDTILFNCKN